MDGGIESFFVPQGDTSSNAGEPATIFFLATRMPPEFNQYSCQVQINWPHLSPFRVVSVSHMQLLQTCRKSNRNRTPMRRCKTLSQVRPTCSFRVHHHHCLSCCLIGARIHVLSCSDEQAAANTLQIQPEASPGATLHRVLIVGF